MVIIDTVDAPDSYPTDAEQRVVTGLLWLHGARSGFTPVTRSVVVGRADQADIVLSTSHVSREHLALDVTRAGVMARDLGSKNGSFIDGEQISSAPLRHSAILRVGDTIALFWDAPGPADWEFQSISGGLFGGPTLARAIEDLRPVARSELSVIIVGETGSGKEAVSRAVHDLSGRKGPLVAVNCATIPEQLAEAQLFGHRRGAFTGALSSEAGYLRTAENGTLFLDEIVELPLAVQAKLLRAIQENEYVPVGETRPVRANVRFLCAAQAPLEQAVARGIFRQDLAARLDGYQFRLPALSARREDIPFLFLRFLSDALGGSAPELSPRVVETLCLYPWPGNVRELINTARQVAVLRGQESTIRFEHLPERVRAFTPRSQDSERTRSEPPPRSAPDAAARELEEALLSQRGNVQRAAEQLGISRGRAYRIIAAGQVDVSRFRGTKK